ncbi:uncharacterized protein [Palaemon carinicauda]|uniref:uncharacterized protein n=1 Tax=Palaemon carinicauda TaxID=392227 RepID=UPI0035B62E30
MCNFCAKKHKSENCYGVLELSGKERGEKIRSLGLCLKCLKSGHMSKDCKTRTRCTKCNGAHSTVMCGLRLKMNLKKEERLAKEGAVGSDKPGDVALLTGQGGNCAILQTAKVQVSGSDGTVVIAQVMFDYGADRSYISSNFVKKCKPLWITSIPMPYSSFGGHTDDYHHDSPIEIDILIGLYFYWTLIFPVDAFQINHVVAMKSFFGYVLSGRLYKTNDSCTYSVPQLLCISSVSESDLCKFWNLETLGVKPREFVESYRETKVFKEFESTVKFVNGRYEVALPWKDDSAKEKLLNNAVISHKRLGRLMVKLEHDKELKKEYQKVFDSYESDHMIEEVPRQEISGVNSVYYMPHRPVVKLSSSSTKIRPVFDVSASCYNGVSLNDCLSSGPSLNLDLVEVLIRFRRWPNAVTADIRKTFLQISAQEKDRDVHRFLWPREDGTIRPMRFTRVPFGNTASQFLLNATIKHHLDKYSPTSVVQDLKANMSTDNRLSGADSAVEAADKFCEARSILADGSMDLTKLVSNSLLITSQLCDKLPFINSDEPNTVLGLKWCNSLDSFSFDGINSDSFVEVVSTKRSILSVIANIFYPLELISPYVMYGKIFFQELWKLGLTWDQLMPSELKLKFQGWLLSSQNFKNYQIDRCYFSQKDWGKLSHIELHGFGDAYEKGYGACVYLRVPVENGSYKVSLVSSKPGVAPIKTITMPRLELLGSLLCSRLVNFVKNTLNLDSSVRVRCWKDSTIALSRIQGYASKKDLFVANRVKEIRELTPPSCWQYCVRKGNPADLITRGLIADNLVNSTMWLYGPSMLKESQYQEREVVKGFNKKCDLSKGDLVLIKEDNLPRLKWPLGVIVNVYKGKDGLVRSVRLKTKKGEMTGPIQRLYNLEVDRSEDLLTTDASCEDFDRDVCDNPQMPIHTPFNSREAFAWFHCTKVQVCIKCVTQSSIIADYVIVIIPEDTIRETSDWLCAQRDPPITHNALKSYLPEQYGVFPNPNALPSPQCRHFGHEGLVIKVTPLWTATSTFSTPPSMTPILAVDNCSALTEAHINAVGHRCPPRDMRDWRQNCRSLPPPSLDNQLSLLYSHLRPPISRSYATTTPDLEHRIPLEGVNPFLEKVAAIQNFPASTPIKEMQELLGMIIIITVSC